MTTRRQHYVAQMYLKAWSTRVGKARRLWCLRRGADKPFPSDTKNVAVEQDFYRLTRFLPDDTKWIRSLGFHNRGREGLRQLNEQWIHVFELFWKAQKLRDFFPDNVELVEELDRQLIEHQEHYYTVQETRAIRQLVYLRAGKTSFLDDDDQAVAFCFFLLSQYFRTKKMKDGIRRLFGGDDAERFDRTWPILRNIFATNVGWTVFASRKKTPVQVVRAPPGIRFITCDQPVINTYGASPGKNKFEDEEFELYYPVSPSHAVIISNHAAYHKIHGQELNSLRVQILNQAIEQVAHEQLFASSAEELSPLVPSFKELG